MPTVCCMAVDRQSVQIDCALLAQLRALAVAHHRTQAGEVRQALSEYIAAHNNNGERN